MINYNGCMSKITLFAMLLCLFIVIGCSNSFPPRDTAEDILKQIFQKAYALPSDIITNITISNKFLQKIDGEEYSVIEYGIAYDNNAKIDGLQIAYIKRGNSWYGRAINKPVTHF